MNNNIILFRKLKKNVKNISKTSIEKTLLVIWARQIGKTYIINEFCKKEFENSYIDMIK